MKTRLCSLMLLLCAVWFAHGALVINEVCFDNETTMDETGDTSSDWIELYNSGPASVNVKNYGLGDANPYSEAKGVRLPDYEIPPGGFLVVFASSDLPEYTAWTNISSVALIQTNSVWRYSAPANAPGAAWMGTAFNDAAWPIGAAPLGYNDPQLNMDCATVLPYGPDPQNRYRTAYFRKTFNVLKRSTVTGLTINARVNDGMVLYLNGVEVQRVNMPAGAVSHNTLATMEVPPFHWVSFQIPATWLVQGNNVLAAEVHQAAAGSENLAMDMAVFALTNEQRPIVHGQFGLSKLGENIHLFNSGLTRIHRLDAPPAEPGRDKSYGLVTDGVVDYINYKVFDRPTPGAPNAAPEQRFSETLHTQKPTFVVPPGFYQAPLSVKLATASPSYRIFYTLDGSDPKHASSFIYSGYSITLNASAPVTSGLSWIRTNPAEIGATVPGAEWLAPAGSVSKATVLRAIAVSADGKSCSPEARGTYFIGPSFAKRTLPAVSIITDPDHLFDFASGIYIPGKHYANSPEGYGANKWGKPHANYHQTNDDRIWERPAQFELFETAQHTLAFSQSLGVAMHGGGTRAIPQKTLYLMARLGEYGADRIGYPLFPDEPIANYKRFLLRNNGNDWYGPLSGGVSTLLKDAALQHIVKGLDLSMMAYRPVSVYINGEYWGIHNMRESLDKHYLATRYGLDADNMDILMHEEDDIDNKKVQITRIDGDTNSDEEYELMVDWIQANPLNIAANYRQVQEWIDVTNHADYIIAETFFANTDWPINNCDFWRAHTNQTATCGEYGDGRWRWMLYDLDLVGEDGASFNMFAYLSDKDMTGGSEPGFLINQLWSNMDFRNHFVTRYANLLNTTFHPERTAAIIRAAADTIAPEVEQHFRRWGRTHKQTQWRQAVEMLVQYVADRHAYSWQHLDTHFYMGGTGTLTVRNADLGGTGGHFIVNGIEITDAAWTGTYFRSLPVTVQAVPAAGYVFDSWVGLPDTTPTLNVWMSMDGTPVVRAARFRPASAPVYTITLDPQAGGVYPENKQAALGSVYGFLPVPSKYLEYFDGWWTEPNGGGVEATDTTIVTATADHTLYAKWSDTPVFQVTFDTRGGIADTASKRVAPGTDYGALPTPERYRHTFGGWWTGPGGTGQQISESTGVTAGYDHTLYAKWEAFPISTVTFDAQGGSVFPAGSEVVYSEAYGALPVPFNPRHVFKGWWTASGGTGQQVTEDTPVTETVNHTLYAKWEALPLCHVMFDAQGGTVSPASNQVAFSETYGLLPAPVNPQHTFGGWWTEPGGAGTQVTEYTEVTETADHTLYAHWHEIPPDVPDPYLCAPDGDAVLAAAGSYDGFLHSDNTVRGLLTVKVSKLTGALTAKAVTQTGSLSFNTRTWTGVEPDGTRRVTLSTRGKETLDLRIRQNRLWGTLSGGKVGQALMADGARNRFLDKADASAPARLEQFRGYYTMALPVAASLSASAEVAAAPQGIGYLTITVGNKGTAKIAGVLADGTKVSLASRLILLDDCGQLACVPFFAPMYTRKGWSGGLLWIDPLTRTVKTDQAWDWRLRWEKPGKGPDGFSLAMDVCGGFYAPGMLSAPAYRFSADIGAHPYHYAGDSADWAVIPQAVDVGAAGPKLTMTKATKPVKKTEDGLSWYEYDGGNPAGATLTFTAKTGLIKGKFSLYYDYLLNGRLTHKAVNVPYAGVLAPTRDAAFHGLPVGMGHSLAPDNDPALKAYRLKRSYPIVLDLAAP